MSVKLLGPWPFDLQAPHQSAQQILGEFAAYHAGDKTIELPPLADGTAPGAYLIVSGDDLALVGFWLVFSHRYLDDGPGQSTTPPYVEQLLEAATEEIWWERLGVASRWKYRWNPLVVLEWPAALAERSDHPPPGVWIDEKLEQPEDEQQEGGQWLEIDRHANFGAITTHEMRVREEWAELPHSRSLICVVRGDLHRVQSRHQGSYALIEVPQPREPMPAGEPLASWLFRAIDSPSPLPETHHLGAAVRIDQERAAFPITGWLSRELLLQPPRPRDATPGELVPRDVRNQLWTQLGLASSITMLVLGAVLMLSGAIHIMAQPRLESAPPVAAAAPQPAMSICSADHQGFVEEFRCQVRRLASGRTLALDGCVQSASDLAPDDLLPAYCGLRDRDLGAGFDTQGDRSADMAASQACYQVLGRPYTHSSDRKRAIPEAFLDSPDKRVNDLADLVDDLNEVCAVYRDRLESRVDGAVLAAHVGGTRGEAVELEDLVFKKAEAGMGRDARRCFDAGRRSGVGEATTFTELCDTDGIVRGAPVETEAVQQVLGGDPDPAHLLAIERYTDARFGGGVPRDSLWRCHSELAGGTSDGMIRGRWSLTVSGPRRYGDAKIGAQLLLDSALLAIREDEVPTGACWTTVDDQLGTYAPVHPLLEPVVSDGWPSEEQQLCGQTCAARYRLAKSLRDEDWVTRGNDVGLCSTAKSPPKSDSSAFARLGEGFEELRVPWNSDSSQGWVEPTDAQICAFNLVAQGRIDGVLPPGLAGPVWSGEIAPGIAGGEDGAAFRAATSLSTYGRARSRTTCGNAAVQCFAGELLTVLSDGRSRSHEWRERWRKQIGGVPTWDSHQLEANPWCRIVAPYISTDHTLPEGQFDYPCALGVDESRRRFEETLTRIASGITANTSAGGAP